LKRLQYVVFTGSDFHYKALEQISSDLATLFNDRLNFPGKI